MKVDVIPASPSLLETGTLIWPDGAVMNLAGLDLALNHFVEITVNARCSVRVAEVRVIALLKMVSFLDRPAERERDLWDISLLLKRYLDDDDDRRWEAPLARIDHEEQSAFALGYDIGAIADTSHRALVNRFLSLLVPDEYELARAARLGNYRLDDDAEERLLRELRRFRDGLRAACVRPLQAPKQVWHGLPGYVVTAEGTVFDPTCISNIREGAEPASSGPLGSLLPFDFEYRYADYGFTLTHTVWVPSTRDESFAEEVTRALDARKAPGWKDPLGASGT
jgi:hypothetical protein